ncbi:uncharacterized protein LOC114792294 isoform X3 [Denticeps clupeoides]|uniref:uncharacterized protein LOC114792294 isoform X3 n=1 Tax=Denticeps clupeoides TaxID=299321 RepID=UPI0010A56DAE|nr:uncharacterized protein LOC114792294 isoform X3 [Denticeps clupeoides]
MLMRMRTALLLLLLLLLCLSISDGKRRGNKKTKTYLPKVVKDIRKALNPSDILNPSKKNTDTRDLAKITEDNIVNEHLRLTTQGKGIANGVCRTVQLVR